MASELKRERVRVRVRTRAPRGKPWWRRRKTLRRVLLASGALLTLAVLDAIWVGTTVSREMRAVEAQLSAGADAVQEGRLDDARDSFLIARTASARVGAALNHPAAWLADALPVIGADVDAVQLLARASTNVAEAGQELVRAADEAGWDGSSIPGLGPGGALDLDGIRRATPALRSASQLLDQAGELVASISTETLLGPVRDGVLAAAEELESGGQIVRDATTLSGLLPGFLGADSPRDYMLVTMDLSDPRGSGGFPGSYGVLRVDGGTMDLERFETTSTLGVVPRVDAPREVKERYERFGALTHMYAATYSPDFPTSARLLLSMWEAGGHPSLDGVIAVDSVWMSYVLAATGPVQTPAWPEPITADNVSDVVNRQTFLTMSSDDSDALQNALGDALWLSVLERSLPARGFAEALAKAARERHLQVYSADPAEQQALDELGASGHVVPGPNPLMVAWDGGVASRVGYFAEKAIDYQAVIAEDGSADVVQTITLTNPAPTDPPSILLGGFPGDVPTGYYSAYVNVYLPPGATRISAEGGSLQLEEREFGAPVVLGLIDAPAGGTDTFRVTYHLPDAVTAEEEGSLYALDVLPLPALRPDVVSVSVILPGGAEVIGTSPGMVASGDRVTWDAAPTTPTSLRVVYRPSAPSATDVESG